MDFKDVETFYGRSKSRRDDRSAEDRAHATFNGMKIGCRNVDARQNGQVMFDARASEGLRKEMEKMARGPRQRMLRELPVAEVDKTAVYESFTYLAFQILRGGKCISYHPDCGEDEGA